MALFGKKRQVQKLLDRIAAEVEKLGLPERRELFIALRSVEGELAKRLSVWLKSIDLKDKVNVKSFNRLIQEIKPSFESLVNMRPKLLAVFSRMRGTASGKAIDHLKEQFEELSMIFEKRVKPMRVNVLRVFSRGDRALKKRHEKVVKRMVSVAIQDMRTKAVKAVIAEETWEKMVKRVAKRVKEKTQASALADGFLSSARASFSRVIRTEVMHAYNTYQDEAIRDLAAKEPEMMKRWDATLDSRVCRVCRSLDQEVVPVTEPFSSGSMYPPAHPNCRCTTVPWMASWKHESDSKDRETIETVA